MCSAAIWTQWERQKLVGFAHFLLNQGPLTRRLCIYNHTSLPNTREGGLDLIVIRKTLISHIFPMESPFFDIYKKAHKIMQTTLFLMFEAREKGSHKFLISVNSPFLKIKYISSLIKKLKSFWQNATVATYIERYKEIPSRTVQSLSALICYGITKNAIQLINANFKTMYLIKRDGLP